MSRSVITVAAAAPRRILASSQTLLKKLSQRGGGVDYLAVFVVSLRNIDLTR